MGAAPEDGSFSSEFMAQSSEGYWYYADGSGNRYSFRVKSEAGTPNVALIWEEMPAHNHYVTTNSSYGSSSVISVVSVTAGSDNNPTQFVTSTVGYGRAHNNLPPYYAVYIWERIA